MRPYLPQALAVLALTILAAPSHAQTPTAPAAPAAPQYAVPAPAAPNLTFRRYAASELQIRDVAAFVRIHPENRADISVAIINPSSLPAPRLHSAGNRLIIDGQLRRRIRGCRTGAQGRFDVNINGAGWLRTEQIPIIEVRAPQRANVSVSGATRLNMGRAENAEVNIAGCGDADLEGVSGEIALAMAGSSDVRLYDAGTASVSLAGDGDATIGVVRNGITVSIAGSGDLIASRVDGPTNIAVHSKVTRAPACGSASASLSWMSKLTRGSANRFCVCSANWLNNSSGSPCSVTANGVSEPKGQPCALRDSVESTPCVSRASNARTGCDRSV